MQAFTQQQAGNYLEQEHPIDEALGCMVVPLTISVIGISFFILRLLSL